MEWVLATLFIYFSVKVRNFFFNVNIRCDYRVSKNCTSLILLTNSLNYSCVDVTLRLFSI